jgi:hypothetical protein
MNRRGLVLLLMALLGPALAAPAPAQRFLPDDPLWTDPDRMDMPFPEPQPAAEGVGPFEFLERTFGSPGEHTGPAQNVNTVGGVPNSSWYTNRHYRFPMSEAALRRGPNERPGPSMQAPWRVVRIVRQEGLPQAVVKDATDRRFRLLFDAPAHPEMATGAAMISSRLLYALGYNVPHHWLRSIRADHLTAAADTSVTETDVDRLLAQAYRRPDREGGSFRVRPDREGGSAFGVRPDSTYRVLVTRIPGVERRIGPFSFHGTRPDDGNDVFPHEARRELRGLKVIAAWINYANIDRRHTLDVGVREEGRRFVRHYLIDLHLTLGSGGATPNPRWAGHEHVLELGQVFERMGTLGLSGGEWADESSPKWPALGRFRADHFDPTEWRPKWPNPAFERCDWADAFWAAKQVRHFSESDLAAIVGTADYSSPQVADYVRRTLVQRRDSIAQAYLHWGGGLDRFAVREGALTFHDLRAKYGLAPDSVRRTITWHAYDNRQEQVGEKLREVTSSNEAVLLPSSEAPPFLRATLKTPRSGTTRVFLRKTPALATSFSERGALYEVVGTERFGGIPTELASE